MHIAFWKLRAQNSAAFRLFGAYVVVRIGITSKVCIAWQMHEKTVVDVYWSAVLG